MNNDDLQKQIKTGLAQYKLEVQNQELQIQVNQANQIIATQNHHIEHVYSSMGWTISILGILLAIFGVIIPIIMSVLSIKSRNELKQIKDNVDEFVSSKFEEWEQQEINNTIDKFIHREITWQELHTILKYKPLTYEQIMKVYTIADHNDNIEHLRLIFNYVFKHHFDNKSLEYEKIRNLILNNRLYITFTGCYFSKAVKNSLSDLNQEEKEKKVNQIIEQAEGGSFNYIVNELTKKDCIELTKSNIKNIVNKLMDSKYSSYVNTLQNKEEIIDPLIEAGFLEKVKIDKVNKDTMVLIIENGIAGIKRSSYLCKKIEESTLTIR